MSEQRVTFSIMDFDQLAAVRLGLTLEHLAILKWFIDFRERMASVTVDGQAFYWFSHGAIADQLPILRGNSTKHIQRLLNGLCEAGVLVRHVGRGGAPGGARAYYAPTEVLSDLRTRREPAGATGQDCPVGGGDRTGLSSTTGQDCPGATGQDCPVTLYVPVDSVRTRDSFVSQYLPPDPERPEAVVEALLSEKAILRRMANGNNGPALRRVLREVLIERGEEQVRRVLAGLAAEMAGGGVRNPMAYLMRILDGERKARA